MPSDLTPPKAIPYLDFSGGVTLPWWLDFSGKLEPFFPQPGPVLTPKKGQPVPAPGNPASEGGSATSGIAGQVTKGISDALSIFIPSASQKRDIAVYGLVLIVFVIAVISMLK